MTSEQIRAIIAEAQKLQAAVREERAKTAQAYGITNAN